LGGGKERSIHIKKGEKRRDNQSPSTGDKGKKKGGEGNSFSSLPKAVGKGRRKEGNREGEGRVRPVRLTPAKGRKPLKAYEKGKGEGRIREKKKKERDCSLHGWRGKKKRGKGKGDLFSLPRPKIF